MAWHGTARHGTARLGTARHWATVRGSLVDGGLPAGTPSRAFISSVRRAVRSCAVSLAHRAASTAPPRPTTGRHAPPRHRPCPGGVTRLGVPRPRGGWSPRLQNTDKEAQPQPYNVNYFHSHTAVGIHTNFPTHRHPPPSPSSSMVQRACPSAIRFQFESVFRRVVLCCWVVCTPPRTKGSPSLSIQERTEERRGAARRSSALSH